MIAAPTPTSTATISPSQPTRWSHARDIDAPPRFTHDRHTANVVAPPVLSSQQSPHTDLRQRAQGPAASRRWQIAQRAVGSPPSTGERPLTGRAYGVDGTER